MSSPAAQTLLDSLDYAGESFALFGDIENDTAHTPAFVSATAAVDPESLPAALRIDIALVRPSAGDRDISVILSRLRDVHAGRVLLCPDQIDAPDATGFVALGFEPRKSPSIDGLVYIWDPALADQPREWNNAENWANPENFSKFRW